jgi:hypothetical protein
MQKNEILVLLEAFLIEHKESDSSMKEFNIEISKLLEKYIKKEIREELSSNEINDQITKLKKAFSNEYFSEKTKEIFQKKIEDLQKKLPK